MAMTLFDFGKVLVPLHELAVLADLQRWERP